MLDTTVGSVPVLYRRHDVSFEDFSAYWRDIHGVFVAGFLGPWRYRFLHFTPYDPEVWANTLVDRDLADERQLGGIAEFVFENDADRHYWLNTIGEFADADDAVVFRRSTSYSVSKGGYRSPKDTDCSDADTSSARLYIMLRARQPGKAFSDYVAHEFGPKVAALDKVVHLQTTVLDPHEMPTRDFHGGEGVDRSLALDEQHQATIEIIFSDAEAQKTFFRDDFPKLEAEFSAQVLQVHAYHVARAYTQLRNAEMTLSGWLGGTRATLARRVNARNILDALDKANERRLAEGLAKRNAWKG